MKETQAARKNIFARIFGKKTEQQSPASVTEKPKEKREAQPVVRYTKKKVSKLKSIDFIYTKVEGLNENAASS